MSPKLRIVHLSDFHFDGSPELKTALNRLVSRAIDCRPDLVVVTGDLSADGRPAELDAVALELARFDPVPRVILPGNRDLVPSVGPPGEARPLPADSDLDFFLALEPALGFGFDEADQADVPERDPAARFAARFGPLATDRADPRFEVVGINSTGRLRPAVAGRAAHRLGHAPGQAVRIVALHHGLLPVPGRKLREGDLASQAGDLLAWFLELKVDLVLHGHIHRAHAWLVSDGHHQTVVASAGALVNDGRRDSSFNEIRLADGKLEIYLRSVATGEPTLLFRTKRRGRS
ncbi:MAG: metallophosphoesterase family protein [Candidatus Limnocylindrales bacterium]